MTRLPTRYLLIDIKTKGIGRPARITDGVELGIPFRDVDNIINRLRSVEHDQLSTRSFAGRSEGALETPHNQISDFLPLFQRVPLFIGKDIIEHNKIGPIVVEVNASDVAGDSGPKNP